MVPAPCFLFPAPQPSGPFLHHTQPPEPKPQKEVTISPRALQTGPRLTAQEKRDFADLLALLEIGTKLETAPLVPGEEPFSVCLARALLRIRDRKGHDQPLSANPAQVAFERNRGTGNIVLKARQMGITTWIAARFFLKTITSRGTVTVLVAQTREAAQNIFQIVQRFWEALDEELREGPLQRNVANVHAMRFPVLDSEFRVLSASDRNAGRGLTMQNLHCSEVARWPGSAAETLAGLRAALAPGGELVLESTPNGAYGCFYEEWAQAVDPASQEKRVTQVSLVRPGTGPPPQCNEIALTRHFFPWWLEPAYTAAPVADPNPEEQQLMLRHNLTPEQIGHRRSLESGFRRLRSQEYAEDPETCFRATGDSCFDADVIDARLAQLGPPTETRRGGTLQLWLTPQPRKKYIVAVDPAGGGETGDFAAIQVIDLETGLQCAELQEHLRILELTRVAVDLAREYNNALIAVERNNHGAGVDAYLVSLEKYPNVYQQRNGEQGSQRGWPTTAASKPGMVGLMGALIAESPQLFLSRRLLAECRSFVALGNGRTGAISGAHDDCFMAMAVAHSVRSELLNGGKTP